MFILIDWNKTKKKFFKIYIIKNNNINKIISSSSVNPLIKIKFSKRIFFLPTKIDKKGITRPMFSNSKIELQKVRTTTNIILLKKSLGIIKKIL